MDLSPFTYDMLVSALEMTLQLALMSLFMLGLTKKDVQEEALGKVVYILAFLATYLVLVTALRVAKTYAIEDGQGNQAHSTTTSPPTWKDCFKALCRKLLGLPYRILVKAAELTVGAATVVTVFLGFTDEEFAKKLGQKLRFSMAMLFTYLFFIQLLRFFEYFTRTPNTQLGQGNDNGHESGITLSPQSDSSMFTLNIEQLENVRNSSTTSPTFSFDIEELEASVSRSSVGHLEPGRVRRLVCMFENQSYAAQY